jgi:hypothetical protein
LVGDVIGRDVELGLGGLQAGGGDVKGVHHIDERRRAEGAGLAAGGAITEQFGMGFSV